MPHISMNGRNIHYWRGRNGTSQARQSVLFIHGAGGSQLIWGGQKSFFEERWDPVIIDLPGHGESAGMGEVEIQAYADHVRVFLKALRLEKVVLVGHSMGGAIVQTLALSPPEEVNGIVLAGTGARLRVFPEVLQGIKERFEETVRKIARSAFSPKAPPDWIGQGIENLLRCKPEVLYGDFLACDRFDLVEEVGKIDLPALILCGDEDELTPPKFSRYLQSQIRGSRLEIIPGAGHMVMIEAPAAFNEEVSAFLRERR